MATTFATTLNCNPEIGTTDEYLEFTAALAAHGMGQTVDFVPNHMGTDPRANLWWRDVLENGRCSPFASFFDIDWLPAKPELTNRILLPILGDQYGAVLERGELTLVYEDGLFTLRYFEHDLPTNPRHFPIILELRLGGTGGGAGRREPRPRGIAECDHRVPQPSRVYRNQPRANCGTSP